MNIIDGISSFMARKNLNNKQVAVIRKEDKDLYKTTEDMKKAIIGAEDGSAGMSCVVKEEEEE